MHGVGGTNDLSDYPATALYATVRLPTVTIPSASGADYDAEKPSRIERRQSGRRNRGELLGVFVAMLLLTAACGATSGAAISAGGPAPSSSTSGADVSITTAAAAASPTDSSPSTAPTTPAAVPKTPIATTRAYVPPAPPRTTQALSQRTAPRRLIRAATR